LVALLLRLVIAAVFVWVSFPMMLQERFGQPWFLRPVPILGFWLLLLFPQWYMIALTLNYLEQRERAGETSSAHGAPVGG